MIIICVPASLSTSSIILPPQGLRLEVIQPWLEQLALVFDDLRLQQLPIGWLTLDDLQLDTNGDILLTDLCREREPSLQQHLYIPA